MPARHHQIVAGQQPHDAFETGRFQPGRQTLTNTIRNDVVVGLAQFRKYGQDCFGFGREDKTVAMNRVDKGLDPIPIARTEQAVIDFVVDRKGPHSVESGDTRFAPLDVRGEYDFRVRMGPEPNPQCF